MTGLYEEWIVPAFIDLSMRSKPFRKRIAGAAEGRVLDVAIGRGVNLPFYARHSQEIFGLDPSPQLIARAQCKVQRIQGRPQHGYHCDDVDRLQYSRYRCCSRRNATRKLDDLISDAAFASIVWKPATT